MILLTNTYECKIDAKGRIVLPSKLKNGFPEDSGNEVVLRKSSDKCLLVYPMVEFRQLHQKVSGLNEFNREHRRMQRLFFSSVQTVEMDGNGRILIPKSMMEHAGLVKEAMVLGTGKRIEIWSPERYDEAFKMDSDEEADLEEKLFAG